MIAHSCLNVKSMWHNFKTVCHTLGVCIINIIIHTVIREYLTVFSLEENTLYSLKIKIPYEEATQ